MPPSLTKDKGHRRKAACRRLGQRTTDKMKFLRSFVFAARVVILFSSAAYYAQVRTSHTRNIYIAAIGYCFGGGNVLNLIYYP